MYNPFYELFFHVFYTPFLNLCELLYRITGDTGVAMIILGVTVNLCMLPLFISTFLSAQKMKILSPIIKKYQTKYQDDKTKLVQETLALYKKYKINNGATFLVIILQLFISLSLFWVINNIANVNSPTQGVQASRDINRLYSWLFGSNTIPTMQNDTLLFNLIPMNGSSRDYWWITAICATLSYYFGMFAFRWMPKLPTDLPKDNRPDDQKTESELQLEQQTKMQEFVGIYFTPAIIFATQFALPAGLNIYYTALSLISLLRQIIMPRYYASHVDKFFEDIQANDDILEEPISNTILENPPIATKIIEKVNLKQEKANNQNKKLKKKKKNS
jgi:YidC/Oxa1 family membrane protein insertase